MPTMTNAYASMHGRSPASDLEAGVGEWVARSRAAWTKHRSYRRTLAELRELPARMLRDLAFDRADLDAIAHESAYGR